MVKYRATVSIPLSLLQFSVNLLFLFSHTASLPLIYLTRNHIRLISNEHYLCFMALWTLCFAHLLEQILLTTGFNGNLLFNQSNISFTIQIIVKWCNLHEMLVTWHLSHAHSALQLECNIRLNLKTWDVYKQYKNHYKQTTIGCRTSTDSNETW